MRRLARTVRNFVLDPMVLICAACMIVALLIPFIWGDLVFGAGTMRVNQLAASAREGISVDIGTLDEEVTTLRSDYYRERAEESERQAQREPDYRGKAYDEAISTLACYLADHSDQAFATSAHMPLVVYLPLAMSRMPGFFWFFPSVLFVVRTVSLLRNRGLIRRAPRIRDGGVPLVLGSGVAGLMLVLLASILPVAAVIGFANGLGDPSYPVMFLRDGGLVVREALPTLVQSLAFLLVGNWAFYLLGSTLYCVGCGKAASLLSPLLILGLASAPEVVAAWRLPDWLVVAIPSTYARFSDVIGYAGCFPTEMGPAAFPLHAVAGVGLVVFLSIGTVSAVAAVVVERLRGGRIVERARQ